MNEDLIVAIAKWDINSGMTARIEDWCSREGIALAGNVSFDPIVTKAQIAGAGVTEYSSGRTSMEIQKLWRYIARKMELENIT